MGFGMLKPLRMTCEARSDVLAGGLADNHFAAQLDKVVRDPGSYPVYGNPEEFFAITYPTSGLRTLLSKAFGRVTGAGGPAGENGVLRSETSFGGGKTHGLTAVYHLARGARPTGIERFVDPDLLPGGTVQIAAIVGDSLDPVAGLETDGVRSYTIWGEMAAQIGPHAVAAMTANDAARTAPGKQTIIDAFGGAPTIVIIDEIAQHLRQAIESGDEGVRRYARSIPAFLKVLFEVAGDPSNRVSVIVTLASAVNAFGRETNEIAELLDEAAAATKATVAEAQEALTRMVQPTAVIKPAEDTEIGEILKARLFARIDPAAATAAGQAYQALYEDLAAQGESLSGGAEQPATYGAQVERSYPFHPELVRVLDKRLGTIALFQRARGSLKLLAEVVAGIYRDAEDADVINVADIDFSDEAITNHLTIGLNRNEFAQVAAVDLAGPGSHAAVVDAKVFPGKPPYATRVGRTVLVHSLEMTGQAGAGRTEWIMGTLRPGEPTSLLETALAESERVFWHLASDGARFRFQIEPNVNAILEEEKANIPNTQVNQAVDDEVFKTFSNDAGFTAVHYPPGPASVPDEPKLRLVVIDPDQRTVRAKDADKPDTLLVDILTHKGQDQTFRVFRNSLVFVLADTDAVAGLKDRIRTAVAAETIVANAERMAQFSDEVRKKIKGLKDASRLEARIAVTRCFKHVYWPTSDRAHDNLRHRDMPAQQQGDTRSGSAVVAAMLKDDAKIRDDRLSYDWVADKTWADTSKPVATSEVRDWFWRDPSLPVIRNTDVLRGAITDGVRHGGWVYYDAATAKVHTATSMAGMQVEFRPDAQIMTFEEATRRGLLVRKPTVSDLRGAVSGSKVVNGTEIRALLEKKCGGEPTRSDVLETLAAAVNQHRYEWIVVLDTDPAAGVKALTPSDITSKGLDSLRILTREHADSVGIVVPGRVVERTKFTHTGASGVALANVLDQVADSGKPLASLRIKASADDQVGVGDINLLGKSLGMLQRFDITVTADLTAEFTGVDGQIEFAGTAQRKDFQAVNTHLERLWAAASAVAGTLEAVIRFPEPIAVDDAQITQLTTVIKTLNITTCTVTGEVVK